MDALTWILLMIGVGLLVGGAELMIRGASRLSIAIGLSPLVVGLTVVAFATSSPELAVCVKAALSGNSDIAFGNVVGSNILNILLILGLGATIFPLAISRRLVRVDVPLMIVLSVLVGLMGLDGRISRLDGIILFAGIFIYTFLVIRQSRKERKTVQKKYEKEYGKQAPKGARAIILSLFFVAAGLALLVMGSRLMVESAVDIAHAFGVSELIVGLTIVALGTSLPEVAATIMAGIRGVRDIAVGNAIGSNIFNILLVLGLSSIIASDGIAVSAAAIKFDLPIMIAVAIACLPIFFTGYSINRWEGVIFLAYYGAYTAYLILDATGHDALPVFSLVMLWFVVPITVLTIVVSALRYRRAARKTRLLIPPPDEGDKK